VCRVLEKLIIVDVNFVFVFSHRVYVGIVADISEGRPMYVLSETVAVN
jgi:ferredoxin-fold anticodon binding domain-containing protein